MSTSCCKLFLVLDLLKGKFIGLVAFLCAYIYKITLFANNYSLTIKIRVFQRIFRRKRVCLSSGVSGWGT